MEKQKNIKRQLNFQSVDYLFKANNQKIESLINAFSYAIKLLAEGDGFAICFIDDEGKVYRAVDKDKKNKLSPVEFDIPIIKEIRKTKKYSILDSDESDELNLSLMKRFNAKKLMISPSITDDEVSCLVFLWHEDEGVDLDKKTIYIIESAARQMQSLIAEIINSADYESQVLGFKIIQETMMDLSGSKTLDEALRSYIKSIEKLFEDIYGSQLFLMKGNKLIYSMGNWESKWHEKEYEGTLSRSLNQNAMKTKEIQVIPDAQVFAKANNRDDVFWEGGIIVAPLIFQDKLVGVIDIGFNKAQEISEEKIRILKLLSNQAANAIERELDDEQIRERASELEVLVKASLSFTSTTDLDDLKNIVVENALKLSPEAMNAFLFLTNAGGLDFGAAKWSGAQKDVNDFIPRDGGLTDTVAKTGEKIIIEDVTNHKLFKDSKHVEEGWRGAIVGVPLKQEDKVIGVLTMAFHNHQHFDQGTINVLQILAEQAALAIENSRLHIRTKVQASTDYLTGLSNRRSFNERLEEELNRARRHKTEFSLLLCDLDNMKEINDKFGHLVGDKALQIVARIIEDNVRQTDLVSRWGGDEFVVLLPETQFEGALNVGKKIAGLIKTHKYPWMDKDNHELTISVGVACYPEFDSIVKLIQAADKLLYKKKENKK